MTLAAVLLWSTVATAFKLALEHVDSYALLVFSSLVSWTVLLLLVLALGKAGAVLQVSRQEVIGVAALGLLNPFLYYITLFSAYDRLPGQVAMSLNYGWPLALTLLSAPILGQRLGRKQILPLVVSFVGAVIIATRGRFISFGELDRVGVLLALSTTGIWALYWLINARQRSDPVVRLFWLFTFGSAYALLFSSFFGGLTVPPLAAWPAILYIGCFEMGITFVLWLQALTLSTSAARLGNLIYMTPFLSLFFLHLIIGETIHQTTLAGLLLIVGSIVYQEFA